MSPSQVNVPNLPLSTLPAEGLGLMPSGTCAGSHTTAWICKHMGLVTTSARVTFNHPNKHKQNSGCCVVSTVTASGSVKFPSFYRYMVCIPCGLPSQHIAYSLFISALLHTADYFAKPCQSILPAHALIGCTTQFQCYNMLWCHLHILQSLLTRLACARGYRPGPCGAGTTAGDKRTATCQHNRPSHSHVVVVTSKAGSLAKLGRTSRTRLDTSWRLGIVACGCRCMGRQTRQAGAWQRTVCLS